tara:strand:- start:68208 stop:68684 length:477 start_codon:yes stop_codon:yes gene_type:complete
MQVAVGGDQVGLVGVSFDWETMDAALEGSAALMANDQIRQMMGDCGVTVHRRSLMRILGERGERNGAYLSCVYTSGTPSADGMDVGWGLMKDGCNGLMGAAGVITGMSPWTGAIFSWTDSIDSLMECSARAWSDPQMAEIQAKSDTKPVGRIIGRILA